MNQLKSGKKSGPNRMVLVETSPIHVEYQTQMQGCDGVGQLVGQYSVQVKSHKWWDQPFFGY